MSEVSEVKVRRGVFGIYDRRGDLVGQVSAGTGRALIGDSFYARERTCRDFGGEEGTNGEGYDFACSACGFCCDLPEPNYCPECGAKVVNDD